MPGVVGTLTRESDGADAFAVGGAANWKIVKKLADESRTMTVTPANDAELLVTLVPGVHIVRAVIYFGTANAIMDMKYQMNFTGVANWEVSGRRFMFPGAPAGTDQENSLMLSGVINTTVVAASTSGIGRLEFDLVLDVTATGVLEFRWSQNTLDAGALTFKRGSYVEYMAL